MATALLRLRFVRPDGRREDIWTTLELPKGVEEAQLSACWRERPPYSEAIPLHPPGNDMAKPAEIKLRPGWLDDDIRRAQRSEQLSTAAPLHRVFTSDHAAHPSNPSRGAKPEEEEPVVIWSGEHRAYWRPNGEGYTPDIFEAGIWTRAEALATTSLCGPEKQILLLPLKEELEKTPLGLEAIEAPDMWTLIVLLASFSGASAVTPISGFSSEAACRAAGDALVEAWKAQMPETFVPPIFICAKR